MNLLLLLAFDSLNSTRLDCRDSFGFDLVTKEGNESFEAGDSVK